MIDYPDDYPDAGTLCTDNKIEIRRSASGVISVYTKVKRASVSIEQDVHGNAVIDIKLGTTPRDAPSGERPE